MSNEQQIEQPIDVPLDQDASVRWKEMTNRYKHVIREQVQYVLSRVYSRGWVRRFIGTGWSWSRIIWPSIMSYMEELDAIANDVDLSLGELIMYQYAVETTLLAELLPGTLQKEEEEEKGEEDTQNEEKAKKPFIYQSRSYPSHPHLIHVRFCKSQVPIFEGWTWPGYVGLVHACKPKVVSVSVSVLPQTKDDSWWSWVSSWPSIGKWKGWLVGHGLRSILEDETLETTSQCLETTSQCAGIRSALHFLPLVHPASFILCGTEWNESCCMIRSENQCEYVQYGCSSTSNIQDREQQQELKLPQKGSFVTIHSWVNGSKRNDEKKTISGRNPYRERSDGNSGQECITAASKKT